MSEPTKLIGESQTTLCADCLNAWRDFVTGLHVYKSLYSKKALYDVAVTKGDESGAIENMSATRRLKDELYDCAKAWVTRKDGDDAG